MAPPIIDIAGKPYYFWSTGKKTSIFLVLFGGHLSADSDCWNDFHESQNGRGYRRLEINELYRQDFFGSEYTIEKEQFVEELATMHDVISPATGTAYSPPDCRPNDFISKACYWMWEQGYADRHLFGFSVGAVAVADYITRYPNNFSTACLASAPVNWDNIEGGIDELSQSAHRADRAAPRGGYKDDGTWKYDGTWVWGIAPLQDFTHPQVHAYIDPFRYPDPKSWMVFDWPSGHDVFPVRDEGGYSVGGRAKWVPSNPKGEPSAPYYRHKINFSVVGLLPNGDLDAEAWLTINLASNGVTVVGSDGAAHRLSLSSIVGPYVGDGMYFELELLRGYNSVWLAGPEFFGKPKNYRVVTTRVTEVPVGTTVQGTPTAGYKGNVESDGTGHIQWIVTVDPEPCPPLTVTLAMASSEGGSTTPPAGSHSYPTGADVTVEAFPNADYEFNHWEFVSPDTPPGTDTRNPCRLMGGYLDRDVMVTPVFQYVPPPPCSTDADCPTGQICVNGVCVDAIPCPDPEPCPPCKDDFPRLSALQAKLAEFRKKRKR